ncbi:Malonyl CoA-acyl carrier protein transacylase [Fulvivirga imtechensis AK7]|uniref:Malonyl CoA-acyl carrier protein transacylase n=1 Tax=Fulvivirga imtechensis AK7 TaxID=1237149 RepID=L8JV18_9BACT|nr:SDR family NAD(P)-dependent oxidoreductase [Fulvivirga imtechensis]ELR72063.1 Malonyl CoA-acyl carrier protein transacylase [Fulvivirga imtechensis AK7]
MSSKENESKYISEQVKELLRISLAEALYLDPSEIEINKSFVDLGLDSIVGVEWMKVINKRLGLEISATRVYDYTTISALASYLTKEIENSTSSENIRTVFPASSGPDTAVTHQEIKANSELTHNFHTPESQPELTEKEIQEELKTSLAEALYLSPTEVDIEKSFVDLGLDSIVGVEWMKIVNKNLGLDISATKVYDYATVRSLASFIYKELEKTPVALIKPKPAADLQPVVSPVSSPMQELHTPAKDNSFLRLNAFPDLKRKARARQSAVGNKSLSDEKIAIIGMSGRYPQASNLEQYWNNLAQGKNSVTEITSSRWDINRYYDPDPTKEGKMYCKWLGTLEDIDCFDPLFFQIPPAEAESMDPQHRIFLQESYRAFEDAGYSSARLSNTKCGVYLGIMSTDYNYHLSKSSSKSVNITGNSFAIGAARIAYFLNLKGPAIPVDTACSSSLVAIHMARQALLNHEIDMALAGGVSLYLNPEGYIGMCQAGMLSPEGQCKAFDDAANGFVPGEGVGAVVLKRLADAERDNDFIYGVILGSGVNQDGKTNGITAPSVNSQIELERDLYSRYNIDPETISYIEAHGTGTKLGDPIELEALSTVFKEKTSKKNFCALGSVKSNIGHTSGAAGVASVQKVLLSMQHRTLVPTLHVAKENGIFDFRNSPFYISKEQQPWNVSPGDSLRRASISSFGFSGTNAHLVIEEYPQQAKNRAVPVNHLQTGTIILLSARTTEQLKQKAHDLLDFILKNERSVDLVDMAYTLQVGRDELRERLAFVVSSVDQLKKNLQAYVTGSQDIKGVHQGRVARDNGNEGTGAELQTTVDDLISNNRWPQLLDLWVKGLEVDWNKLYGEYKPRCISLPTYPFARERYWVEMANDTPANLPGVSEIEVKTEAEIKENVQEVPYQPVWKKTGLSPQSGANDQFPVSEPVLVIDTTEELYRAMEGKVFCQSGTLVLLQPNHAYKETEQGIFTIDPGNEEHFYSLIESLKAKDRLPHTIIHQGLDSEKPDAEAMEQQLNYSFYTLFYMCKALISQKYQTPLQILSLISGNAGIPASSYSALGAFFKTLTLENPKYRGKVVEIMQAEANQRPDTSRKVEIVLAELSDQNRSANEIRYQAGAGSQEYTRYVRTLTAFDNSKAEIEELPLKQKGVYIISGGLGGLGLIFSEYLAKNLQCNLVLFGRSELQAAQEEKLNRLKAHNTEILYLQADASKLEDMERVVKTARTRFSQINGIIHSAGINKDSFILKKSKEEADTVLKPKICGAINLDLAAKDEQLDLFVLFSSIAGVMGNPGQCDYAYANRFLDAFAENREHLVQSRRRSGKTLSVNWPYWEEGGMLLSHDDVTLAKEQTGFHPLPTKSGVTYLENFLKSGISQGIALYGLPSKVRTYMEPGMMSTDENKTIAPANIESAALQEKTEAYLKELVGREIKLDPERIDPSEPFDSFGIDSIIIGRMNVALEKDLGALSKTLFYEYPTIEELAAHLSVEARPVLTRFFNMEESAEPVARATEQSIQAVNGHPKQEEQDLSEPIAIIGVHGYYPQSEDLDKYWENLKKGKDMIDLVPGSRWNYEEFFHEDPEKAAEGKIYCKWGGFVKDVDKFDPHFFNISPEEAKIMDPQERLFLESVWTAIEDAGYTRETLKKHHPKAKSADVGVFVGVTTNTYNLLAAEGWSQGNAVPSAHPWSIANRVSYFFDFQGPSMPVDTACSSSSVAIHLACESLKKRECQVAVAGGVNLYLHPSKYHSLCKNRMVSQGGQCRSYGAGDDGFVPGEGVGSVLLKPLSKAIEDNDHIYAVIKGSVFDHSGRSNGYAAPNPNSQANLISQTLNKINLDPASIGYVEGHGTGTQLGDSLEIVALTNAFRKQTEKVQFCPIGSVKANIGHPEAAAGIAGLTKILLQMKHRQLVPTIHSEEVNPNIEFETSPFYLQHKLASWESSPGVPLRALMNSFGAGGVNACMVIEEYKQPTVAEEVKEEGPYLVILSAKNEDSLRESVNRLLTYIGKETQVNLEALAYTLQVGREAMPERLALVVSDRSALMAALKDWRQQKSSDSVFQGKAKPRRRGKDAATDGEDIRDIFEKRDITQLAKLWITGVDVDWEKLYPQNKPRRISLPTSPFTRERYWALDDLTPKKRSKTASYHQHGRLHPLVSYNSSTLREIRFSSLLSNNEFYAQDHRVNEEQIFPGSGFIEIAGISGNIAGEQKVHKIKDIVWAHPLAFKNGTQLVQTFLKPNGTGTAYQIVSFDDENERVIHSEGKLFFQNGSNHAAVAEQQIPVAALKEQCPGPQDGAYFYELFRKAGFNYGPAFQTVQEFYHNGSYALSKLKITDSLKDDFDQYILHPSLLDGALQTVAALISGVDPQTPYLPFAIDEVELIRPLPQACYAHVEYSEPGKQDRKDIMQFNIQLLNEEGAVLVRMKNFYARALRVNGTAQAELNLQH